jgi:V/A-type H+-transporting ATPase subunit E
MSHKEFLKALEEDARKEIESVLEKASVEADEIIKQAVLEKEKKKKLFMESFRLSLDKENTRAINKAKKNARKNILDLQHKIVDEIFIEAERGLTHIAATDHTVTEALLLEALQKIDVIHDSGKIYVHTSKKERALLEKIKLPSALQHSVELKVNSNNEKIGITVTTEDGKITVNNSFDSRLKKIKHSILPYLNKILFLDS